MLAFLRRRRPADLGAGLADVAFCDGCGQVCTAECRAAARYDRVRTVALADVVR